MDRVPRTLKQLIKKYLVPFPLLVNLTIPHGSGVLDVYIVP
jgi:hypothetical protein